MQAPIQLNNPLLANQMGNLGVHPSPTWKDEVAEWLEKKENHVSYWCIAFQILFPAAGNPKCFRRKQIFSPTPVPNNAPTKLFSIV